MFDSTQISGKKAQKLVSKGAVLIDTRSPVQFRDGTLTGAVNIAPEGRAGMASLVKYPKTTKLVLFGDDAKAISTMINYASQLGFMDVYTFGKMENWEK